MKNISPKGTPLAAGAASSLLAGSKRRLCEHNEDAWKCCHARRDPGRRRPGCAARRGGALCLEHSFPCHPADNFLLSQRTGSAARGKSLPRERFVACAKAVRGVLSGFRQLVFIWWCGK